MRSMSSEPHHGEIRTPDLEAGIHHGATEDTEPSRRNAVSPEMARVGNWGGPRRAAERRQPTARGPQPLVSEQNAARSPAGAKGSGSG